MARPRRYPDETVIATLAELTRNGGNLTRAAETMGVPVATVQRWRDLAEPAAGGVTVTKAEEYRALWGEAQELATKRITELVPNSENLKEVAYAAQVASNAYLDHRDGRRGAVVNVDARHQAIDIGPVLAALHEARRRMLEERAGDGA